MKKNEIEDLLLSEMEEVNGGSGSSTCVCDYGGAGETIVYPSVPGEPEKGWVECTFSQIEKRDTNSPCKHCKVIDICRKSINRRVCFVDISKTLGKGYFDYPDPRCPNSTVTDYIL